MNTISLKSPDERQTNWFVVVPLCEELETVVLLPVCGSQTNTIPQFYDTHIKYTGMCVVCWLENLQWLASQNGMC